MKVLLKIPRITLRCFCLLKHHTIPSAAAGKQMSNKSKEKNGKEKSQKKASEAYFSEKEHVFRICRRGGCNDVWASLIAIRMRKIQIWRANYVRTTGHVISGIATGDNNRRKV